MKSNVIAKGLLSAAVAGLVAGAIAPTTAFAGKDKKAGKAHSEKCEHGKDCKNGCKGKEGKDNGCSGKDGCTAKDPGAAAKDTTKDAAPAPAPEHK
jgi:hypothetical protein